MIIIEKRGNMNIKEKNIFNIQVKHFFMAAIFLIVFIAFLLTGCGKKEKYNGYYIYGLDATEKKIMYEKCSISKKGKTDVLIKISRKALYTHP